MAKSSQTFKKRQRESKLRERAQLKRQRREERRTGKKQSMASEIPIDLMVAEPVATVDSEADLLAPIR